MIYHPYTLYQDTSQKQRDRPSTDTICEISVIISDKIIHKDLDVDLDGHYSLNISKI